MSQVFEILFVRQLSDDALHPPELLCELPEPYGKRYERAAKTVQYYENAGLPVYDIMDLRDMAEKLNGKPHKPVLGDKEVAKVIYRDGTHLDTIYNVPVK